MICATFNKIKVIPIYLQNTSVLHGYLFKLNQRHDRISLNWHMICAFNALDRISVEAHAQAQAGMSIPHSEITCMQCSVYKNILGTSKSDLQHLNLFSPSIKSFFNALILKATKRSDDMRNECNKMTACIIYKSYKL